MLIEESALRYRLGRTDVMTAQLGHLLSVTALPTVKLGVIPFTTEARPMWTLEAFTVFDDARVHIELLAAQVTAKGSRQPGSPVDDLLDGMHGGDGHQSLLQVDHDERGRGVEGGECHRVSFRWGGYEEECDGTPCSAGAGFDALGPRRTRAWDMIVRSASTMTSPRALTTLGSQLGFRRAGWRPSGSACVHSRGWRFRVGGNLAARRRAREAKKR